MAQSAVIHEEFVYSGHNAVINAVCYNRLQDCFVSCDDASLRLWAPSQPETDVRIVTLPPRTSHFLQALVFVEARQLYVASALDGTLKIYDQDLNEVASIATGRSAILSLAFDATHSRLFSGGVDGCAAWDIRGKPLVGPESILNPLYEFAAVPGFFHIATASTSIASVVVPVPPRASYVNVLPSAGSFVVPKPNSSTKRALKAHDLTWVQSVQLNREQTRLYAHGKHRVDVFSTLDGHHVETFMDPVPPENGAITAFVLHEKTQYLVCGCLNGYLYILSVHPTSVVHVFKDHTMAVTSLAVHLSSHLIISSSLDGTVRLWDLEARRQAHRLDIRQPVYALSLLTPSANPCRFYCRVRSAVMLYTIQSAAKEHLASLSPISLLQRVVFPTALAVTRPDAVIPGEKLSSTRHIQLSLPSTDEAHATGTTDEQPRSDRKQWILAAGTDRTVRLFSGRTANEAPSFTWIPEERALDVTGVALHPQGNKLVMLLESQKLLLVDIHSKKDESDRPMPPRVIDMNASPLAILGSSATAPTASKNDKPTASSGSNVAANPTLRGAICSVCCCYYPPLFRSSGTLATSGDTTAQLKWFSRTFVNRRHQSKRDLKRLDDLSVSPHSPTRDESDVTPLLQSEREWIVCGSEFGHLIFWHSGLTNSFQEAIALDAHDASVVAIAASASSPLCVSLDASRCVHIWQFQPVFTLRQMIELNDQPSCFVLAPTSELLLTGYDDGAVVLMNVSDSLEHIETISNGSDERHDAMISGADFLDAKLLVLTASVDAVIKIWDHQKNLLRQLQIAMALTCLCFMNDDGDVMAGVASGIFVLSKDDLMPEKLPEAYRSPSPSSREKKLPFWLGGDEPSATSGRSPLPKEGTVSAKGTLHKKESVKFVVADTIAEAPLKGDEAAPADRVESPERSPRPPATWKRRTNLTNLELLMGSETTTLHPPVLRPLLATQPLPRPLSQRPPSSRPLFPAKDPDWRDVIMPTSQRHTKDPFAQRNRRLKPPSASSAIIAELKALAHAPPRSPPMSPRTEHEIPQPTEALGIGAAASAPLQYCKHQAPVPPKAKTPRKLWNAIGGEDRRLLAVQRNLPSLS